MRSQRTKIGVLLECTNVRQGIIETITGIHHATLTHYARGSRLIIPAHLSELCELWQVSEDDVIGEPTEEFKLRAQIIGNNTNLEINRWLNKSHILWVKRLDK